MTSLEKYRANREKRRAYDREYHKTYVKKYPAVNVTLSVETEERLAREARRLRCTRQAVIRRLLDEYLEGAAHLAEQEGE